MHKIFIFIALAFFLSNIITHVEGGESDIVQNVGTSTDIKPAQTYSNKFNELELKLERHLEENVKTKLPQKILQMDNILTKINENVKNQLDGQFIQQILEEARHIFVSAQSNLKLIVSKLHILTSDPVIKGEVIIYDELRITKQTVTALHETIDNHFYIINTYHSERAKLLKNLERAMTQWWSLIKNALIK
uniref:Secreted protein n=1 Tax=Globodera rostochiensis TaxID=31243 RepID=A0A914H643_GLORO